MASTVEFPRVLLQSVARLLLLAVVLAAPWCLGGVEFVKQQWLYAGVLASLVCWGMARAVPGNESSLRVPTLAIPLIGALLLGSIQLLSWPDPATPATAADSAPAVISEGPNARNLRTELGTTLSFSTADTRLSQGHMAMALLALCLAADLFAPIASQRWLWIGLALNGAALAGFGIVQKLTWNGKLFWTIPLTHGGQPFASYVNRNNAAGYLTLSLAGVLGWLVWSLSRRHRLRLETSSASPGDRLAAIEQFRLAAAHSDSFTTSGAHLRLQQIVAILAASIIVAGIVCSMSRSGFLGVVGGALPVLLVLIGRRKALPALAIIVCVLGLSAGVVVWTGMGKTVEKRLATLWDHQRSTDARLENWQDAVRTAQAFPIAGTGLGTYRYAYQPFQVRHHDVWFMHTENQYLQALVEGGAVGLGLMLSAILLVLAAVRRLFRPDAIPFGDAAAVFGLSAILSQCLQACFDFGLYLPANMLAMAVVCGAVTGSAVLGNAITGENVRTWLALPPLRSVFAQFVCAGVLVVQGLLGWNEIAHAATAHQAMANIPRLTSPKTWDLGDVDSRISELNAAAQLRPDDAELQRCLANLWIYRYRLQIYQRMRGVGASDQNRWDMTSLTVLHRQVNQRLRQDPQGGLQRVRQLPLVAENLVPAVEHLLAAQAACPLLPEIDLKLAALAFMRDPAAPQGDAALQHAARLSVTDPEVLFDAGQLAKQAGRDAACFQFWRQCLSLSPRHRREIVDDIRGRFRIDELITKLLPDDPEVVLDVLVEEYAGPNFVAERELLKRHAQELATAAQGQLSQPQWQHLQARFYALENKPVAALEAYRRAVALAPFETAWRLELAKYLKEQGKTADAQEEAEICAKLQPDFPGVNGFLRELAQVERQRLRQVPP